MDTLTLSEDKQPDFLLTINFPAGLRDPQRIFASASDCIKALQECDSMLLKSFPTSIQTIFVLEEVQTGSLKVWLRQCLEALDDDAIKNIDWKPAVGRYLVKGKYLLLKKLEGRKTLPPKEELLQISDELHSLAKETDALRLPVYTRVPEVEIAKHAKLICDAMRDLHAGETLSMSDDDGDAVIDAEFSVTDEDIKQILVNQTIENTSEVILMVRRPDFLGESKWDFRFNRRNLSVSILDRDWLAQFQSGEIDIRPGDALHVSLRETVAYDSNGEVVSEDREIIRVKSVIRKQMQTSLLDQSK